MTGMPAIQTGCFYHIYNRGNNGVNIFKDDSNYLFFLKLYTMHINPVAETYAYCLLKNHFHLLVYTNEQNNEESYAPITKPGQCFGNFFNAYAKSMNNEYQMTGSLFEHPFKRTLVENQEQLLWLVVYIHQNPQKHGFVEDFRSWYYSSYPAMISQKPTHLQREKVIQWFGGVAGFEYTHSKEIGDMQKRFGRIP